MLRRSILTALLLCSLGSIAIAFVMAGNAYAAPRIIKVDELELAPAPCPSRPTAQLLFVGDGPGSGAAIALPATPADQLHDPTVDPAHAFDDVKAFQKLGWPFAVLASLIMAARGLQSAGKRWPDVRWITWLNTGARAFVLAGLATVSCAAFNTLALGGTWFAVAMAAAAAGLALLTPSPKSIA